MKSQCKTKSEVPAKSKQKYYASPRWSAEVLDCSMPMTFDTYSRCSYNCLYCFAFFQKSMGLSKELYGAEKVNHVNVDKIKRMYMKPKGQFASYIEQRKVLQWGGMSDPFDEFERRLGVTLELLKFFQTIKYPICFSTKGAWWTEDERYMEIFEDCKDNFNMKFSIITRDDDHARLIERGCPSSTERLKAMERLAKRGVEVTLRLRPYIIGTSDKTAVQLIKDAANAGAVAVSTELMCLERRSKGQKKRNALMSKILGYDIEKFYIANSKSTYMRLNRNVKRPLMAEMKAAADEHGLRFYVSDAHFKELCHNGSCCGLSERWNYSRGQFTEALLIAKKNGTCKWSEISEECAFLKTFQFNQAEGFNTNSAEKRAKFHSMTMFDYVHWNWNNPNGPSSPYKYFGGAMSPCGKDKNGDIIYEYVEEVSI